MLLIFYIFGAFLFFKVFPEFGLDGSNTVTGSLVMALSSAFVLLPTGFAINLKGAQWVTEGAPDLPWHSIAAAAIGIAASIGVCWLVGWGFSERLMSANQGHGEPMWVLVMFGIPPLAHCVIMLSYIIRLGRSG